MSFFWKHLHGNVYDVFVGNGWDNWSRIRVGWNYTPVIAGNRIPESLKKQVIESIMK